MRNHALAAVIAVGLLGFASPAFAAAPTKKECIDANAQAQSLEMQSKLSAAQSALKLCASTECPAVVRDDCAQRFEALAKKIPSLVFEARTDRGADLGAVSVTLDGQPFAPTLDGSALIVDPGEHTFVFASAGLASVTKKLVVRLGDRDRHEAVVFVDPNAPAAVATPAPTSVITTEPPADDKPKGNGRRALAIGVGAAGVVGLGLGAVFGWMASSSGSSSKDKCASTESCIDRAGAQSDLDSARSQALVSNIAFIAGAALLAGGVVLWLTAPKKTANVGLAPSMGGGALVGTF